MKKTRKTAVLFLFLSISIFLTACSGSKTVATTSNTSTTSNVETLVIATSAQCGSCKSRIEPALKAVKGVNAATLDLETKQVTVKYDAQKTSPDAIRKAIAAAGYDADNISANTDAYQKLPACCQKGGHD